MTRRWLLIFVAAISAGCGREEKQAERPPASDAVPRPVQEDRRPVIVAFGDSLTAGYGLAPGLSYADALQKLLDGRGFKYRVVNLGISGDTTSGGAARMDEALSLKPKVVILELGANDGLRGLPVETTRANLTEMIDAFQRGGAKVLLCGMTLPRNYGPDYIRAFEKVFRELAHEKKTALMPFLLDGVVTRPELMQGDGMHPTAQGCALVAANVMKYLEPMLRGD